MNLPSVGHRQGLHVRLGHACPRCDGPHLQRLPQASILREQDWCEYEDCQHVWALRYIPTRPANRWDAR